MKSYFLQLLLLLASIALNSCEGNTTRKFYIDNQTSSELKVISDLNVINDPKDSFFIEPGKLIAIGRNDVMGGNSDPRNVAEHINSLFITNENGDSLIKDYTLNENWEIGTTHRSKIPSDYLHEFVFTVTDADFE